MEVAKFSQLKTPLLVLERHQRERRRNSRWLTSIPWQLTEGWGRGGLGGNTTLQCGPHWYKTDNNPDTLHCGDKWLSVSLPPSQFGFSSSSFFFLCLYYFREHNYIHLWIKIRHKRDEFWIASYQFSHLTLAWFSEWQTFNSTETCGVQAWRFYYWLLSNMGIE